MPPVTLPPATSPRPGAPGADRLSIPLTGHSRATLGAAAAGPSEVLTMSAISCPHACRPLNFAPAAVRRAARTLALALILVLGALAAFPHAASAQAEITNEDPTSAFVALPILNYLGNNEICDSWIEAQNIGDDFTRIAIVTWGAPGFCPPQCAGPLKVECSGLLKPGSSWNFIGAQIPSGSKSAIAYSLNARQLSEVGLAGAFGFDDVIADVLCETLFFGVVGDCDDFRRFHLAYTRGLNFAGMPMAVAVGEPIAVEVLRRCSGPDHPNTISSKYSGIEGFELGVYDPVFGGHSFYAPSLYATASGFESVMYLQNAGLDCTTVEIWFQQQDDCLRALICEVFTLAPGETFQFHASDCVGPGWIGSAWLRTSQPMAIAVDHIAPSLLMTYQGMPGQLRYTFDGEPFYTPGSVVAYGPLVYSEYQGWDSAIQVQNLSGVVAAKVKVYFLDRSGDIITTLADWVCPRGSQTFFLPAIAGLPGNWVGTVRVESQEWFTPGGPPVPSTPITAIAQLIKYADIQRTSPNEAIAYNLLQEFEAYDWQIGSGLGGLESGVGLIAVPSLLKDLIGTGVTTELAIANLVPKPGFTDFAIYIYDMNGLIDFICQKLGAKQVEYIDLQTWGYIANGFKGSAIISATFWEHDVFDNQGNFLRNLVGLGAVIVERTGTALGQNIPGDPATGTAAFPIYGAFDFEGPHLPLCPGFEGGPGFGGIPACPLVAIATPQLNRPIPDGGTLEHAINVSGVPIGCLVGNVSVSMAIAHPNAGELTVSLVHAGEVSQLFAGICPGTANIVTTLDDDAPQTIGSVCPAIGNTYATQSGTGLKEFNLDFMSDSPNGAWTIRIEDTAGNGVAGTLLNWSIQIQTARP
jgi:hypothetical protein